TGHRAILDYLPKPLSRRDRRLAEAALLDAARVVKGESRDRITAAFEALGSVRVSILHLRSQRWWKRAEAAERLGLMRSRAAADLTEALRDPEWPVRAMAAKALGRVGGQGAIAALCEALKDRQWWVRANAAEALRLVGPAGRDALIRMLDADDTYARHQAVA